MKTSRAFTLMEILVVLAIIAVLAGLLFPVLAASKRNAKDSVSLSNLHQLGIACGLYQQETGVFPASAALLVPNSVSDTRVLVSPNDATTKGQAWHFLATRPPLGTYKGRMTYAGPWELGRTTFQFPHTTTLPDTTRGLLVDLSTLRFPEQGSIPEAGRYHRLTEDLSIVTPVFNPILHDNGQCMVAASFLDDYEKGYIEDECRSTR